MFKNNARYIYFFILLHLIIVLPLAFVVNIWVDEASTIYTTQNGLFYAIQNAGANEKQAPLYFWILSLWREIDGSVFFARTFSVICSCGAIYFFYDLTRRLFSEKTSVFVAAFFALHPYLIWASTEIRVYSLVILLSVLLLNFFEKGYLKSGATKEKQISSKRAQLFFVLAAIFALYVNYYLGFLLAGCFFSLLAVKKWSEAKVYFLEMLVVGVLFLPAIWMIEQQFSSNTSGFQPEKSLIGGLQILQGFFLTFVLPTELFPAQNTASAVSIFRVWLLRLIFLIIAVLMVKNRRELNEKIPAFVTIPATIFVFLFVTYFLLGPVYLNLRHAAVLFAPLILSVGLILQSLFIQKRENAEKNYLRYVCIVLLTMTLATFFAYSIYTLYPNLTKRGDWAQVASFIEENEKSNQPIVVFTAFDALAPRVYYRGLNQILPDEKFFDWELEDAEGTANSLQKQTEFIISEIPPEASEIWLVTNEKCLVGASCELLENFVQANYTIILEKDFYKENVRLLRRK